MNLCSVKIRITCSDYFYFIIGFTPFIALIIYFSFAVHFNGKPGRKCIYNRSTYTVTSSGYLISSTSKFSSGMKNRKYNLKSRFSCFMIRSHRNTASVILYCYGIIFLNGNFNIFTITSQSFIYRIIHNFVDQMV